MYEGTSDEIITDNTCLYNHDGSSQALVVKVNS
mgnify:CR=1 FL=1